MGVSHMAKVPFSFAWIQAVLISSLVLLPLSTLLVGAVLLPVAKVLDITVRRRRLPRWVAWTLVLPAAVAMGYLGELAPRLLFTLVELAANHHLLFRPGFDYLVWQVWSPLFFVMFGSMVAPDSRRAFLLLGGLHTMPSSLRPSGSRKKTA